MFDNLRCNRLKMNHVTVVTHESDDGNYAYLMNWDSLESMFESEEGSFVMSGDSL